MAQFAQPQHPQKHWKDDAIAWSEGITDAWEVTKVVTGRLAEWILFGCMIANIVGILPGVSLPPLVTNIVMGIQIVTLDIAGFGLATMAENARANGAEKAANQATATAYLLIAIMMLTLVLFTLGIMVPSLKTYTSIAENVLILVRVGMIVFYGHVVHSLRSVATVPVHKQVEAVTTQFTAQMDALSTTFHQQVQGLTQQLAHLEQGIQQRISESSTEVASTLQQQLSTELAQVHESLHHAQEMLAQVPALQARLHEMEDSSHEELRRTQTALERQIQEMKGDTHEPEKPGEHLLLHVLPTASHRRKNAKTLHVKEVHHDSPHAIAQEKWDARAFVFRCLHANEACKLSEIRQLARAEHQELSESSISRYRDQYRKLVSASTARTRANEHASSLVETASSDEETTPILQEEDIA